MVKLLDTCPVLSLAFRVPGISSDPQCLFLIFMPCPWHLFVTRHLFETSFFNSQIRYVCWCSTVRVWLLWVCCNVHWRESGMTPSASCSCLTSFSDYWGRCDESAYDWLGKQTCSYFLGLVYQWADGIPRTRPKDWAHCEDLGGQNHTPLWSSWGPVVKLRRHSTLWLKEKAWVAWNIH